MTTPSNITVDAASEDQASILSNLLQLYAYELSDVFALEVGANGRFKYDKLPLYWSEPEQRFPFFIRNNTQLVGFALITRGSPAFDDSNIFDVAEFFILKRYRRANLGKQAAALLWDRFPNRWAVRVSEGNQSGCQFWHQAIGDYTHNQFEQGSRPGEPHAWRVFSFSSKRPV